MAAAAPEHTILAPVDSAAPADTECLMVVLPGFGIPARNFEAMARSAQERARCVRLWVALADLDFGALAGDLLQKGVPIAEMPAELNKLGRLQAFVGGVVEAAQAQGFKAAVAGGGRTTNLYLCAQSAAGVVFSDFAFAGAKGFVLLASAFDGAYLAQQYACLEDWGRPVLILGGELDGQMRWFWNAPYATDAALLASKTSAAYAAVTKPFILVPGANHGHTCGSPPNLARGDIPSTSPEEEVTAALGTALGAFLAANEASGTQEREEAAGQLLGLVQQTAALTAPYLSLKGVRGTAEAWGAESPPGSNGSGASGGGLGVAGSESGLLSGARRTAGARVSGAVHPAVVAEAERFVVSAQLALASTLPLDALSKLKVVASIHTEVEMVLRNQPTLSRLPGSSLLLLTVPALLWFPSAAAATGGEGADAAALPFLQPAAPQYWIKLKRPQAIAEELGLDGAFPDGTTARKLQQATLAAAIDSAPPSVAARYREAGKPLVVGEDVDFAAAGAEKFLRESRMKFTAQDDGAVCVSSPTLTSPTPAEATAAGGPMAAAAAAGGAYMRRFLGNYYVKVMSVAQAYEWVALDSLRGNTPW